LRVDHARMASAKTFTAAKATILATDI
jgi:hypothetical protein